ncbi:hypothetical protein SAMN05421665_2803 [Yoonia rosea]|uniref:Uncharacterized protein n=1 Tax=Yoonia rosea TaxID=287098 RepID=A0A1R3XBW2_9RHOB|nr:hypothetical protein SAMN05421665_2803 [Yoonia rosea]
MTSAFFRHFIYFAPAFALISIAIDFVFGPTWPPEFREIAISAVTAGLVYATLRMFWGGLKKEKGEQDDQSN